MGYHAVDTVESLFNSFMEEYPESRDFKTLMNFFSDKSISGLTLEKFLHEASCNDFDFVFETKDFALRDVLGDPSTSTEKSLNTTAGQYYESIADHDLLSAEEEVSLFRSLETGREWESQLALSTPLAIQEYNEELERILDRDLSVKNLLDISRTEKMSDSREEKLLEKLKNVSDNLLPLKDKLVEYVESDSERVPHEMILTLRGEILTEFNRIDVDAQFIKDLAGDLRDFPSDAGLSDEQNEILGQALSLAHNQQNHYRNRIVASNLKLVVSQVKNFLNRGLSYMDLVQEGNLGLLEAIKGFEYEKGYKFSTYATWWIRQAMQRAIHQKKGIINIPVHRREEMAKVFNAREKLRQELKRNPKLDEIADKLNWPSEKVEEILAVEDRPLSLDSSEDDDDRTLEDEVAASGIEDVESSINNEILMDSLQDLLKDFDWREQQLIRMRFGLDDENEHTLKEIGDMMNLSKERVRQIEKNVLAKLRKEATESELNQFIT